MIPHKTPSISIPPALLEEVDAAAKLLDLRRSQAVRDALVLWLSVNRARIREAREQAREREIDKEAS